MASMEDLIATIAGGMNVGQQANDLKELHAKLAQTLQQPSAHVRPIPPQQSPANPSTSGPMPPPAPASSWNDAIPSNPNHLASATGSPWSSGWGNSPRQIVSNVVIAPSSTNNAAAVGVNFVGQRETGFVPAPRDNGQTSGSTPITGVLDTSPIVPRLQQTIVLPLSGNPIPNEEFTNDVFRPLWDQATTANNTWQGFGNRP